MSKSKLFRSVVALVTGLLLLFSTMTVGFAATTAGTVNPTKIYAAKADGTVLEFNFDDLLNAYVNNNTAYKTLWESVSAGITTVVYDGKNVNFKDFFDAFAALKVKNFAEYVALADAKYNELPDTAYAVGSDATVATNPTYLGKLQVASVSAITNTKIKLALEEEVTTINASDIAIVDKDGKAVAITAVSLVDGTTVYATTAAMVAGNIYTVTVRGESFKFVAKPATDTKLEVSSAMANNSVEIKVTFSANVDPTTALVAGNYAIDNSLSVESVVMGDNANEVVLTTNTQVAGKLYKLTVSNVLAENGNALKTDKNVAYFGGKAKDEVKPTAVATALTNTRFKVVFTDASSLDDATTLNTANYVIDGLKVLAASFELNSSGDPLKKNIVLTTEPQTAGKLYTVTVNNIADIFGNVIKADTKLYFGGIAKDEVKPTAVAQSLSNTSVKVTFTDASKMDEATAVNTANYVIDGLTVVAAELDDHDVTLTTSSQTAGKLYTVVINNVADEYGNVIKADTKAYFGGKAIDTTAPTYTATALNNTTVRVSFSDAIDKDSVIAENFYVKDFGYAVSAKLNTTYDSTGKTVDITTLAQTSGTIYTLEVRNVVNTDGTAVKSDSKTTFAGMGAVSLTAPKLLAAVPVDSNTITLTFDQNLAVAPTSVVLKNNAGTTLETRTGSNVTFKGTSKTEVTVIISSTNALVEGTLYKAEAVGAIGANGIALDTSNDEVTFAGVTIAQTGASVLAVSAIDNNTVKVYFDKPVKFANNASTTAATINLLAANKTTVVNYDSTATAVTAQSAALSVDGTEMTLYFHKSGSVLTLTEGTIYTVQFDTLSEVVTVAGGKNLLPDVTGALVSNAQFGAVAIPVAGPELLAAVAQSRYVLELTFDKPVQARGTIANTLAVQGTNMPTIQLVVVDADDASKVRVYLNDNSGAKTLTEGVIYALRYTPNVGTDEFADATDASLKASLDTGLAYKEIKFAALGTIAAGPAITAVANVNANTFNVTLDQVESGLTANSDIVVKEGSTDISANVQVIVATNKKSFKVVRTDGIFKAGTTYSIALTTDVKDISTLRAADATVVTTFGGNANVDLVLTAALSTNDLTASLHDSSSADVNGKELRLRVVTDDATPTTITGTNPNTTATGAVTWTLGSHAATEVYSIEATDGSVVITFIHQ